MIYLLVPTTIAYFIDGKGDEYLRDETPITLFQIVLFKVRPSEESNLSPRYK